MPINYVPHDKQVSAHVAFLLEGYKRGVLFFGRQTGKTYFSTNHAWLSAVIQQGRYGIVFKTYKQAHEVVWRQYVPLIPKELIYKKNEQDLIIELHYVKGPVTLPDGTTIEVEHDESKPRSTIQLLGSDQADSHRGFRMDGLIFDEYAQQDPNNWDAVYKHFFTTTNGWAIFMGTPQGYNHFFDLVEKAKEDERWFYLKATWRDSPYVNKDFIEEERKEAEKDGKLSTFLQEVELEFRAVQEAVYPMFDRDVHVIKPMDVPEEGTLVITVDFGWAEHHPTAVNFILVDKEQDWYIFDEIHVTETQLSDIAEMIKQKIPLNMRVSAVVADSARPDLIDLMAQYQLPMVPAPKKQNSVAVGIQLVGEALLPRTRLIGPPKPKMFFTSNCKNTIRQFEAYRYKEIKKDRLPDENPIKDNDDHPDGIRYGRLHFKFGLSRSDKLPKNSVVKTFNEYGL